MCEKNILSKTKLVRPRKLEESVGTWIDLKYPPSAVVSSSFNLLTFAEYLFQ